MLDSACLNRNPLIGGLSGGRRCKTAHLRMWFRMHVLIGCKCILTGSPLGKAAVMMQVNRAHSPSEGVNTGAGSSPGCLWLEVLC